MSLHAAPTSSQDLTMSKRHFSLSRALLCALPLLALLLWVVALSGLAEAGGTATADSPARISVQIPAGAKSASVVMLEMSIAVARQPSAGHLGAVVRVRSAGGAAIEVGRISLAGSESSYQFNVARALGQAGGSAEVEVSVIDRGGGPPPSGAALTIGRAQIVTR
jgi:hypothetical protein